jgi:outer membrane receptor protein involved in Fe transport
MSAPVNFLSTGINSLILANIPPRVPISWADESFLLGSTFTTRTRSAAIYHQSTLDLSRWTISLGLRFDIEQAALNYLSETSTGYILTVGGQTIHRDLAVNLSDRLHRTFHELSPKFTVSYRLPSPGNTLYATVSRGFKAGGYNTQMFSDILQQEMMAQVGVGKSYDPADIIAYRPERSWNYELGYTGATADRRLTGSATLYWMEIRDQQMTAFPEGTTTGRIMTNAGRTRSRGVELALTAKPIQSLTASVTYGLTDARFRHYNNGLQQLDGNHVPYAPTHTIFASATWQQHLPFDRFKTLEINANLRGIGPIYWDEANTVRQNLYFLLGASVTARLGSQQRWAMTLWGENITSTQYDTFYFVSIENKFLQRGRPHRFGLTLRYAL